MFFRTVPYERCTTLADLSRKRDRERFSVRREPYWQKLEAGAYLGFRRGPDTWIARYRGRDGKQLYHALSAREFDDAKREAETWLKQMGAAVRTVQRGTVREALETYAKWLREQGREEAAKHSESRFRTIVWDDPLASIPLAKLTREDMREWRERLREGRQARSINRHVRSIVAGLNRALAEGHIGNASAWKLDPLADDVDEGGETAVMLASEQRAAIIAACEPCTAALLRGLELTGARPKELAAAIVSDFDARHGLLKLSHRKGRPARLRARMVVLSVEGAAFFKTQTEDKLPKALLFPNARGRQFERHDWADEIRAAVTKVNTKARGKARIPPRATAYAFRHARISELLQEHGLDPLTVAAQTGTSVRMIERSYFKFIPAAMQAKLAAIEEA
jgi:integrase